MVVFLIVSTLEKTKNKHMAETVNLQHEIAGVPHTLVTDIIEQDAGLNPEAWSSEAEPLFAQKDHVALGADDIGVEYDHSRNPLDEFEQERSTKFPQPAGETVYARPTSSKSWLVNVYGSRWATDTEGNTVLQTTSLTRLPELHQAIVTGILVDEHSRPSKLVEDAAQAKVGGEYTDADIKLWLETVRDGFSPVMATGMVLPGGDKEYITHDYTDFHTASNLLWGREIQDRVTKAAGYEIRRRENGSPVLGEGQQDGVYHVDSITCSERQIDLLDYAMHGPGDSPKERMLAAWNALKGTEFFVTGRDDAYEAAKPIYAKWQTGQHLDAEVAALNVHDLATTLNGLEDFIQWSEHDGARLATEEEKEAALVDAVVGITRVAEKLLGVHDGTDLALPGTAAAQQINEVYPGPAIELSVAGAEPPYFAPAGAHIIEGSALRGLHIMDSPEQGDEASDYVHSLFPDRDVSYVGHGRYGVVVAEESGLAFKVYRTALRYSRYEQEAGALKLLSDEGLAPKMHLFVDADEKYRLDYKAYDYTYFGFGDVMIPRQSSGRELPVIVMDRIDAAPLSEAEPSALVDGFCKIADVYLRENIISWDTEVMVDRQSGQLIILDVGELSQQPIDPASTTPQAKMTHDLDVLRGVALDLGFSNNTYTIQNAYRQGGMDAVRALLVQLTQPQ